MAIKWAKGYKAEAFGTAYGVLIPPVPGYIPMLNHVRYICGSTEHILWAMRCVATTELSAAAASGQTDIVLEDIGAMQSEAGADENIAANDFLAFESEYGVVNFDSVASVSGSTVTLTSNLATKCDAGATVYIFGQIARPTNIERRFTVSVENDWQGLSIQGGAPGQLTRHARSGAGDPMLLHIDNATAAGFLHAVSGEYVPESDVAML